MIHNGTVHQCFDAMSLRISDEHLTEMIITYKLNKLSYSIVIKFIENIVQQQNRLMSYFSVIEIKLR